MRRKKKKVGLLVVTTLDPKPWPRDLLKAILGRFCFGLEG
jgi:hypothetical protein